MLIYCKINKIESLLNLHLRQVHDTQITSRITLLVIWFMIELNNSFN